jgi:hypothetical protein
MTIGVGTTGVIKTNGGIITDQMLAGSLLYFKITTTGTSTDFGWVISDGTVNTDVKFAVGNKPAGNAAPTSFQYFTVGAGRPVPYSAVERVLDALSTKCNIVDIGLVKPSNVVTEIHLAVSGTGFGWIASDGSVDITGMQNAVNGVYNTYASIGGSPSSTTAPSYSSITVTSTIVQTQFKLA